MATTGVGRIRDLLILMQRKLKKDEVALLSVTGGSPAAEIYILNRKTGEINSIQTFATVREMNRWASRDLSRVMAEFI